VEAGRTIVIGSDHSGGARTAAIVAVSIDRRTNEKAQQALQNSHFQASFEGGRRRTAIA
jgi:hypothetical protein